MQKIALITDSSCDLDIHVIEKYNIKMLPLRIIYKDKEFLDRVTITPKELFDSLKEEVPTTSIPDLKYATNVFEDIRAEGYTHAIVITVSSNLSGTFNSLRLISEDIDDLEMFFFDSRTLGYPVGSMVLEAAKMLKEGKSFEEVVSNLPDIKERVHGFITFDTLEYLKKGGRIGKVAGTIGEILKLKPIVTSNEEGVLCTYSKVRGRKQSISKLREIAMDYLDKGKCRIWVLSGDADIEAGEFLESIKDHVNISEISLETIGPAMGVHTGPGAIGLVVLEEK